MLEVLAYANTRKVAGDLSTYQFVLDRGQKNSEVLKSVWDMEPAKEILERSSHTRLELLQSQLNKPCVCEGQWLSCVCFGDFA